MPIDVRGQQEAPLTVEPETIACADALLWRQYGGEREGEAELPCADRHLTRAKHLFHSASSTSEAGRFRPSPGEGSRRRRTHSEHRPASLRSIMRRVVVFGGSGDGGRALELLGPCQSGPRRRLRTGPTAAASGPGAGSRSRPSRMTRIRSKPCTSPDSPGGDVADPIRVSASSGWTTPRSTGSDSADQPPIIVVSACTDMQQNGAPAAPFARSPEGCGVLALVSLRSHLNAGAGALHPSNSGRFYGDPLRYVHDSE